MGASILITGGVRSGKSSYALELARNRGAQQKCFIATAEALDEEMQRRIHRHQSERGNDFLTIEEPLLLATVISQAANHSDLILVDCLTLWINNLLCRFPSETEKIDLEINTFLERIQNLKTEIIFVTNETGLGIIPKDPLSRHFVDKLGKLNQQLAKICDEVILMVCGIPQWVKGGVHAKLD